MEYLHLLQLCKTLIYGLGHGMISDEHLDFFRCYIYFVDPLNLANLGKHKVQGMHHTCSPKYVIISTLHNQPYSSTYLLCIVCHDLDNILWPHTFYCINENIGDECCIFLHSTTINSLQKHCPLGAYGNNID